MAEYPREVPALCRPSKHSTIPLHWGWYKVVFSFLIPRKWKMSSIKPGSQYDVGASVAS